MAACRREHHNERRYAQRCWHAVASFHASPANIISMVALHMANALIVSGQHQTCAARKHQAWQHQHISVKAGITQYGSILISIWRRGSSIISIAPSSLSAYQQRHVAAWRGSSAWRHRNQSRRVMLAWHKWRGEQQKKRHGIKRRRINICSNIARAAYQRSGVMTVNCQRLPLQTLQRKRINSSCAGNGIAAAGGIINGNSSMLA